MTHCPHCQHELSHEEYAGVCPHCGESLGTATVADIGDATVELTEPVKSDPNATVNLAGDATVELSLDDAGESLTGPKPATTPIAADATLDFGADEQPPSEDSISLEWGDAAARTARVDQTIQIGQTVSGFRSSLPIKSRAMRSHVDQHEAVLQAPTPTDAPDYELLDLLGQGGMGVVYTAKQSSIARTVAVKMLKPKSKDGSDSRGDEDQRDKFISEAVITGELEHPNIVPIYDLGANDEGALFYSMKRVRGTPWDKVISQKSLLENLGILMRVADAVAFAHANGVIHRDLKPENTMLGDYGEVLVMDWGLARVTADFPSAESVYQAQSLGGTPAYMAPEMATGPMDKIDHRSDVYLLGAILYEIIGGKPPHTGRDAMACLLAASRNKIIPTDYQGELLTTALRAMQAKPEDRFQSVKEFQQSVQEYLSHAESVALADSAARNLEQARASGDYELYSKALFAFDEAVDLWDENTTARVGRGDARLAYARTAKQKGDLDLGLSLLETPIDGREGERDALVSQLRNELSERNARQRRLRDAKRAALALLLTVIGLGAYSYYEINKQRNEAVNQKQIAETQREIAEEQRELATENEQKAVANAELARQNEQLAKENEQVAIRNEQEAVAAKSEAEAARNEAVLAQEREEYEAYVARIGLAAEKIEENAFREALTLLEACPEEMRQWEWGRLRYLCDLSDRVYDLGAPVDAVAYSPDGAALASGDWSGRVVARSNDTGQELWSAELGRYVHSVAYSPEGSRLAAGTSEGAVVLLDAATGETLSKLTGHQQGVLGVGFSPDGKRLVSCGYDQTARVWDLSTETDPQVLRGHSWWVWSAVFSPDGSGIVTAGQDGKAIVWRRREEQFLKHTEFTGHEGPVYDAAFSPDGRFIASCSYDQTISVWRAEVGLAVNLEARIARLPDPPRDDQRLTGHTGAVRSVDFDPRGERLLSGGQDNTIRVWDLAENASHALRGHGGRVRSVAFSPDGRSALSAGHDNQVRVWDVGGYREQRVLRAETLRGHQDAVLSARFSQDGRQIVTASRDRTARIWDAATGATTHELSEGHAFLASSAVMFDQGKRLATSAGDNTTRLWDVASGVERHALQETGRSAALAVASNAVWLATGGPGGAIRWWDSASGGLIQEADLHEAEVTALAASPDSLVLASGDERGQIRLWRRDGQGSWSEAALLRGHSRTITGLAFTPDGGRLVSASGDHTCAQWDVATGAELRDLVLKHPGWVSTLSLSADGSRALTASDDGAARVWRLSDAQLVTEHQSDLIVYNDADLAPDGHSALLTSAAERRVYRWDLSTGAVAPLDAITERGSLVWSARYGSEAGTILIVGGNDAQLWTTDPLRPAMRFSPHGALAEAVLSPDGGLVATGSWDTTAKLWDARTGKAIHRLAGGHQGFINSIDFSPAGDELLTAGDDGLVRFWRSPDGALLDVALAGHRGRVLSARYTPDGRRVLTASSDKTARLWDRGSGEQLLELASHEWGATSAVMSPDGRLIVTGSDDNTAIIWDAESAHALQKLAGHTAGVSSVAISPDSKRVLTGGQDGAAKLWDAATGKELLTLAGHTGEVTWVEFSPTGRSALTAGRDGAVILWPTSAWGSDSGEVAAR